MNCEEAILLIARAGGDELLGFLGAARIPTSREALLTAARVILEEDPPPPQLLEKVDEATRMEWVIREIQAQALEAWWLTHAARILTKPSKRLEMIAFIEARTGRPLPLEEVS